MIKNPIELISPIGLGDELMQIETTTCDRGIITIDTGSGNISSSCFNGTYRD